MKEWIVEATNEERAEGSEKPGAAAKQGKGNLFVILVGLLVMVLAPLASWLVVRVRIPSQPRVSQVERAEAKATVVLTIDPLVVNISGTRMTRVLRLQCHLVLSEARLRDVLTTEIMPMVKDRIMATASRRTLDELENLQDREALKRDIVSEVNHLIRDRLSGTVLDVAFSEFLIQ